MKTLAIAITAGACLLACVASAWAKPPSGMGGGSGGSGDSTQGGNQDNNPKNKKDKDSRNDDDRGGNNVTPLDNLKSNLKKSTQGGVNVVGPNLGRGIVVNRNDKLGDSGFDGHRIGALDESKYKDRKDNDWRYRRWGSEWWYWVPGGYWMYYSNNDWRRYDPDTYENTTNRTNFNGPYYEDSQGFYYIDGQGRRVYDPQIRRVAS